MGETRSKALPQGLDLLHMADACCMVGSGRPLSVPISSTHSQFAVLGCHFLLKNLPSRFSEVASDPNFGHRGPKKATLGDPFLIPITFSKRSANFGSIRDVFWVVGG